MPLDNVGILTVDSNRSRLYLQVLAQKKLLPRTAVFLGETKSKQQSDAGSFSFEGSEYDLKASIPELLEKYDIPYLHIEEENPNSPACISALKTRKETYFIYSGPGGIILKDDILSLGKEFLHVHPGLVPQYRGSTTAYYSLLKEGNCGATAFFMRSGIDTGPVIAQKVFPPPKDMESIDLFYDPYIRALLLAEVLGNYKQSEFFPCIEQNSEGEENYYIIHPVLKHVAMLSKK